ncbi:hypothetical protein AVEN_212715-1, partial [Araneus ventricosus]
TDLDILSYGQMTGRTPKPAPALRISIAHQRGGHLVLEVRFSMHQIHIHGISLMESGFEPRTLRPKPRPYHNKISASDRMIANLTFDFT